MNAKFQVNGKILKTKRLVLRPFNKNDLDDFYEYAKVDGVGEQCGWKHHESIEESKKILNMFIEDDNQFAIVYNNKVIGSVGVELYGEDYDIFEKYQDLKGREIGFCLSKDYWNKGLMTEAVKEVIRYLLDDCKFDFIICGHDKENIASAKVQAKCGFIEVGIHHIILNTKEIDSVYSIIENNKTRI